MEKKYCPMSWYVIEHPNRTQTPSMARCPQSSCAWWDEAEGKCVVWKIAARLA